MQRACLFLMAAVLALAGTRGLSATEASVYESDVPPVADNPVDKLVFAKLRQLGIQPALCSDAVFVRRAYIDIIGTLPTAEEVRDFLNDPDRANKRRVLIDRLLERDEFADYWAMKWGDILRIKAEFPVNLWPNAAQAYHRWVRASIVSNKPYDVFARELLTSSGSNFRVGPVNFYRAVQNRTPEGIASAVALTLMGARAEAWPAERLAGMAVFFSQIGYKPTSEWKEEHVFWDPLGASKEEGNTAPGKAAIADVAKPPAPTAAKDAAKAADTAAKGKGKDKAKSKDKVSKKAEPLFALPAAAQPKLLEGPLQASFPDGTRVTLSPDLDPREVFADWLISPKNPWFARAIVNRVWWWFMGRGIVHEPDDFRPDNPPSNPELLAFLEKQFVEEGYDLKRLYRRILNTATYQFSAVPRVATPEAEANFATYPLRRLEAEVLIDAINKITGTTDLYTSAIPEPYTYIPENMPAIAIADGSITSPFLALFGRSARATGMENERNNKPVPAQWLHLLNSSHIQRKLEQGPKLRKIFNSPRKAPDIIEELYLTILSRYPTAEEQKMLESVGDVQTVRQKAPPKQTKQSQQTSKADAQSKGKTKAAPQPPPKPQTIVVKRQSDWIDITWALLNSSEFLYRH